jgi:hypothetical protein
VVAAVAAVLVAVGKAGGVDILGERRTLVDDVRVE